MLNVKNLAVKYGRQTVFQNLNFELMAGDFLCLVGANGSGKSTLIRAILGLIKPTTGKIDFDEGLRQNFIGYLSQNGTKNGEFPASVLEIVRSGTLNQAGFGLFYKKEQKERAREALSLLNISPLTQENFCDLSGGQKQKVLLARGLAATTKLLILDEPSNNLDRKSKLELYSLLKKLNQEQNLTIILITHDLDSESLIGNKILQLNGREHFFGTTQDFLKQRTEAEHV